MLTQRSEGLRRLLLICQIWITAGLFWLGVWVMVKFYSPGGELTWRRYSIYCVLLVLGLTLEYLGRDSSRDYPLQTDLLREHRVSLRQAVASIGTLVIYLIATKDGFISRVFLFNFVPCFYLALLFSHHYLPPFLARGFFKGIRAEKTLVVGSPARAGQLHNWLQQKSEIGLHMVCQPACAGGRASRGEFSNTISECRDNNGRFRTRPARYLRDKADLQPGLRSKL
jgi:hypothetical protein